MSWEQLEKIFDRSIKYSLSRKKLFVMVPILLVCGLFFILCQALALGACEWVRFSLTFLPIFLSFGLLLSGGAILIRMNYHDLKGTEMTLKEMLQKSWRMLLNMSYLALPLLFIALLVWTLMGIFYLLRAIPGVGEAVSILLAIGPFLLILGSLFMTVFAAVALFFVTPEAALKTGVKLKLLEAVYSRLKQGIFSNTMVFLMALLPVAVSLGLLYLAALWTGEGFFAASNRFAMILQRFFIMIPFCALLTPSIVFFFNFSTESFLLAQKKTSSQTFSET